MNYLTFVGLGKNKLIGTLKEFNKYGYKKKLKKPEKQIPALSDGDTRVLRRTIEQRSEKKLHKRFEAAVFYGGMFAITAKRILNSSRVLF